MNCRYWNLDNDYEMITEWLKEYDYNAMPPKEILSKHGIMVEEDGLSYCAAALYLAKESANFAYMYGIFSNPEVSKIRLYKAMVMCIDGIKKMASDNNISLVYTTTGEDALCKLYNKNNMTMVETNLKSFVLNIQNKHTDLRWLMDDEVEQGLKG